MEATRCLAHIWVDKKRDLALVVVTNIAYEPELNCTSIEVEIASKGSSREVSSLTVEMFSLPLPGKSRSIPSASAYIRMCTLI